ncbi:M24B family metallopeptidase [Helicobacter brantae]|uniref:Xaa-Pro aminopeptidase n=1 Tax=Helicobacter brantae TaxID=375927 RepID=A0A3D8IVV4_9HELI|nr:M24B family metallopeptidase [Helicobacter brantae]RDU69153.1 Xaa-Pro aminopeptidase [Helicobacter brantae]
MNPHKQRLEQIREMMRVEGIDAYILPMSDPHLSEYIPSFWKGIEWLCGFSGSAGVLLITQKEASLWTDGRYWLQAQKQLQDTGFVLQKATKDHTYTSYLLSLLPPSSVVGIDGRIFSLKAKSELESLLHSAHISLHSQCDLLSPLWQNRPPLQREPIFEHPLEYALQDRGQKLSTIREKLRECGADSHLIASLEDIAWISNLRGSDIECNPVFMSYLLIEGLNTYLFIQEGTLSEELQKKLESEGFIIKRYEEIEEHLKGLRERKILLDPERIPSSLSQILHPSNTLIQEYNPSLFLKSIKSKEQIEHIKNAMEQDGVALCHLGIWLEESLRSGERISELDIESKLHSLRASHSLFWGDSFNTIVGFNANGAQCHYRATKESYSYIDDKGFLLLDSGGSYLNGTTDITRVFPIGEISKEQKRDYTLVLKAHIAMSSSVFPQGIAMPLLDALTRAPLWKYHLDYAHGTGHGVGYFLNVHEGPQVLSYFAPPLEKSKVYEGMITSIEPGIYREGKWGIRLENLVVTQLDGVSEEGREFLRFEALSLYPFERECLELELLEKSEREWINSYHQEVYSRLSKYLDSKMQKWLEKKCERL